MRLQHIAIMSGAGRKHPQSALYPLERGDVQAYDESGNPTHLHPDYRGQVTIKGVFTQGLNTVVTLIVYGEFVDIMEIDANKNVTYDLA